MSITNLLNKIKQKLKFDKQLPLLIITIMLVAGASFGLGRLSLTNEDEEIIIQNRGDMLDKDEDVGYNDNIEVVSKEKRYVASKNGTKYYSRDCGGARRIKLENQIWFKDREDAEKSGFSYSSTCK